MFYPKNVFCQKQIIIQLWNLYHCYCHAWKPQGAWSLVHLNTKRSDVLSQNVFCQKQIIIQLWNLFHCDWHAWKPQGAWSLTILIEMKMMFYPKMCFVRNRSSYSFETCTIVIGMPENLRVNGVWSSKYKEKWCFSPKCVLSETDHHTALKLVPLWLACLKTSGLMAFGPLNTKRSDVLPQNVFCQKQIIIQLWNLYHCDWHVWKPQGARSLAI